MLVVWLATVQKSSRTTSIGEWRRTKEHWICRCKAKKFSIIRPDNSERCTYHTQLNVAQTKRWDQTFGSHRPPCSAQIWILSTIQCYWHILHPNR
jgi:hypothetical protein